jgi:hypothetical protein
MPLAKPYHMSDQLPVVAPIRFRAKRKIRFALQRELYRIVEIANIRRAYMFQ